MQGSCRAARRGFTLIELLVAVVVAGILAAVAYPSYTAYVNRARRGDAVALLTAVVQAQERYRSNHNSYTSSLSALQLNAADVTRYYDVAVTGVGAPADLTAGYVATASVRSGSAQSHDSGCAQLAVQLSGATLSYLAYDSAGAANNRACWAR